MESNQLDKIRELLESAQNPLFFFDNDADGLCSFLIMQRKIGKGKGIPIKSYPELSQNYLRKIDEFNPDIIFILDKAQVSEEFIEGVIEKNLFIVWIDHHQSEFKGSENVLYYNSYPSAEPTSEIVQEICREEKDLFFSMIGCISDSYMPARAKQFEKEFPELLNARLSGFEALHSTEIGKFALMLNFGLMNSTTNVVKLMKYLMKINGPYDILEENYQTKEFHSNYSKLKGELDKLLSKVEEKSFDNGKIIYFKYGGRTSMSSILANQIYFRNRKKVVIVGYERPEKLNLSIRGKNALKLTNKIIEKIDGVTGGGHEEATGAMIPSSKIDEFEKLIKEF